MNNSLAELVAEHNAHDIELLIYEQLPERLWDMLRVELRTDPYHLGTTLKLVTDDGRTWTTRLKLDWWNGRRIACKLPDAFVAQLCLVL